MNEDRIKSMWARWTIGQRALVICLWVALLWLLGGADFQFSFLYTLEHPWVALSVVLFGAAVGGGLWLYERSGAPRQWTILAVLSAFFAVSATLCMLLTFSYSLQIRAILREAQRVVASPEELYAQAWVLLWFAPLTSAITCASLWYVFSRIWRADHSKKPS